MMTPIISGIKTSGCNIVTSILGEGAIGGSGGIDGGVISLISGHSTLKYESLNPDNGSMDLEHVGSNSFVPTTNWQV